MRVRRNPIRKQPAPLGEIKKAINDRLNSKLLKMVLISEAFNGTLRTYSINGLEKTDINTYMDNVEDILLKKFKKELVTRNNFKVALILIVRLFRMSDGEIIYAEPHFRSNTELITKSTDLSDFYKTVKAKINESF